MQATFAALNRAATFLALALAPAAALAGTETFAYLSTSADVQASFSVYVAGGVAQSGQGTISSLDGLNFGGVYGLTLLTSNSQLPAGNGGINPTPNSPSYGLGSGFTWHGVTGSGGADFIGDAVVNANPNYLDDYGLIFAITDQNTGAIVGGINIWANQNEPNALFATNLTLNGANHFENSGSGVLSPVPEPASFKLFAVGLVTIGLISRRWTREHKSLS
ncbi:MAG: hypothetical protein JO006_17115 [Paucibacter sp.]|nr:hypothetical protein [Roseateles sp.]